MKGALALTAMIILALGPLGCSKKDKPTKSTLDKLYSHNTDEQWEGLDEAEEKYGSDDE